MGLAWHDREPSSRGGLVVLWRLYGVLRRYSSRDGFAIDHAALPQLLGFGLVGLVAAAGSSTCVLHVCCVYFTCVLRVCLLSFVVVVVVVFFF